MKIFKLFQLIERVYLNMNAMISIIMILAYVASAINMIVIFSYFAERK